jgi:hypothetical protein
VDLRPLGRTGVQVSPLCLGTMMFGVWGNTDHDDSSGSSTARSTPASTSSTPPTSTPPASRRRSSARRSKCGGTTSCSPPSSACRWARTLTAAAVTPLDHPGDRELAAPTRHRLHRPLPTAPRRPGHRHRRDTRRPHRPRPAGQGPLHRVLPVQRRADRRRPVDRSRASAGALPHRAAALLAAHPRHRGRRPSDRPAARHGHLDLQPVGRRLAVGIGAPTARRHRRPASGSPRALTCRCPRNSASSKSSSNFSTSPTTPACR